MTHEAALAAYEAQSSAFTALNAEYNRAQRTGEMSDELELQFLRAERALKDAYAVQAALAPESSEG